MGGVASARSSSKGGGKYGLADFDDLDEGGGGGGSSGNAAAAAVAKGKAAAAVGGSGGVKASTGSTSDMRRLLLHFPSVRA